MYEYFCKKCGVTFTEDKDKVKKTDPMGWVIGRRTFEPMENIFNLNGRLVHHPSGYNCNQPITNKPRVTKHPELFGRGLESRIASRISK